MNVASSIQLTTTKMVAPCGIYLFLLVFMNHGQTKNHNYQAQDENKFGFFLSTCTPIKHNNKTPFMKNPKAKM
jgi:hypothetical protein